MEQKECLPNVLWQMKTAGDSTDWMWEKVETCFLKVAAFEHKKEISYAMVS